MSFDTVELITELGPFRFDAKKYFECPQTQEDALKYFEYGKGKSHYRLPTIDEYGHWRKKAVRLFHPDKIGVRGDTVCPIFLETSVYVEIYIRNIAVVDIDEPSEAQILSHNAAVWDATRKSRNDRIIYLKEKYGTEMTTTECINRIKNCKSNAFNTYQKYSEWKVQFGFRAKKLLEDGEQLETEAEELEEWNKILHKLSTGVKMYSILKAASNILSDKPSEAILFPTINPLKDISVTQRFLINVLNDIAGEKVRVFSAELTRQRLLCDVRSRDDIINDAATAVKTERKQDVLCCLKSARSLKRYCKDTLEINSKRAKLQDIPVDAIVLKSSSDIINYSSHNISRKVTANNAHSIKRARSKRVSNSLSAKEILMNHDQYSDGEHSWAVRVLDFYENPEKFVTRAQTSKEMYALLGPTQGRLSLHCDKNGVPPIEIATTSNEVQWLKYSIFHPRAIGNKNVIVYQCKGTWKTQRFHPTRLQLEGKDPLDIQRGSTGPSTAKRQKCMTTFWSGLCELRKQKVNANVTREIECIDMPSDPFVRFELDDMEWDPLSSDKDASSITDPFL